MHDQEEIVVSIAVPARNEEKNIGRCLDSIAMHFPADISREVIVGDHQSIDRTAELARERGAKVLSHGGKTVAELRNDIVTQCRGRTIIFLDADTTVTATWGAGLRDVLEDIEKEPYQVTGSVCIPPKGDNIFLSCWFSRLSHTKASYLGTGHMIVAASFFNQLNGFKGALKSGEDYDFCMRAIRAGGRINIRPWLAVIHHDYPLTASDFIRRERWHGLGDFQSFHAFFKSKVALATVSIGCLHLLAVFLGFWLSTVVFFGIELIILALIGFASWRKFKNLAAKTRIINIAIFHLYFWGRLQAAFITLIDGVRTAAIRRPVVG